MDNTIFKIVYKKPTFGGIKQFETIVRRENALRIINKCRRFNYFIVSIEHI